MPNPGQPTISPGATGEVVRRLQRGLRRAPDLELAVDGVFGWQTESAVKSFQKGSSLMSDGVVGPLTWHALPDGGPMPLLSEGSTGDVVRRLQTVLTNGPGQTGTPPPGIDGVFGPRTRASVEAFQHWGGVGVDGVVGDQTWAVSLHAASATLETEVGLNFVLSASRGPASMAAADQHPEGPTVLTLADGTQVRTFRPPPGFDPLTADDTQLQRFGFPPRPAEGVHLQRYQHVINRLQGKLNYIVPTLRLNTDRHHGPRQRPQGAAAATETSNNWSGGVVFAPAGQSFSWIQGDWVIPNVDAPTENQWYYSANWIGIDGDGSGDVCQAGIECEAYRSGTSVTRNIYPWWEWFPQSEVQITNFPVNAGDMVTALLCAGPGAGATNATIYLTNRTTGDTTSVGFTAPQGTALVGNCAEWVVEAPTVSGQQSAMADYGEVFFSVCEAFLGTIASGGTTVDGGTGDNINMTDSQGAVVSDGNVISPKVIQCAYVGTLP
jgi:peptidoglycan hydrolase-like protein with peptidoglycan-binding domain